MEPAKAIEWKSVHNLNLEWWLLWIAHRRKMKLKAYVDLRMAKRIAKYPQPIQQAAIEESMTQGWAGVFPEKISAENLKGSNASSRYEQHTERLRDWLSTPSPSHS